MVAVGGGDKQSARVEFESQNASDSGTGEGQGEFSLFTAPTTAGKLSSAPPKSTRGKNKMKKEKRSWCNKKVSVCKQRHV